MTGCHPLALLGRGLILAAACGTSIAGVAQPAEDVFQTPPPLPDGKIVIQVVSVEDRTGDPEAAGRLAAKTLKKAMADEPLKVVIVSECFEDRPYKQKLLDGLASVLPKKLIVGEATYGSFTQHGCTDFDSVCLLGIGGRGVGVAAALVTDMGTSKLSFEEHQDLIQTRLHAAGVKLADKLPKTDQDRLMILVADAHSPKNAFLVEGVQEVTGPQFPLTGGCANKNAGQTFVYFQGRMYEDSAVAVLLSGDFTVSLAGRMAKDNDSVIRTANEAAAETLAASKGKPLAAVAFNCAGRRGQLKNPEDELAAIRRAVGRQLPLFGCYCAGEIGPLDASERTPGVLCGGSGWHVMFTVIGRKD